MQTGRCKELPTCPLFTCSSLDAKDQTKNRHNFDARSHGHGARSRGRALIAFWLAFWVEPPSALKVNYKYGRDLSCCKLDPGTDTVR